jgi:hypothetical protein
VTALCCALLQAPDTPSTPLKALVLTKDHLAMYPEERARIEKAGGHVTADGRLNGRIQVCSCMHACISVMCSFARHAGWVRGEGIGTLAPSIPSALVPSPPSMLLLYVPASLKGE